MSTRLPSAITVPCSTRLGSGPATPLSDFRPALDFVSFYREAVVATAQAAWLTWPAHALSLRNNTPSGAGAAGGDQASPALCLSQALRTCVPSNPLMDYHELVSLESVLLFHGDAAHVRWLYRQWELLLRHDSRPEHGCGFCGGDSQLSCALCGCKLCRTCAQEDYDVIPDGNTHEAVGSAALVCGACTVPSCPPLLALRRDSTRLPACRLYSFATPRHTYNPPPPLPPSRAAAAAAAALRALLAST